MKPVTGSYVAFVVTSLVRVMFYVVIFGVAFTLGPLPIEENVLIGLENATRFVQFVALMTFVHQTADRAREYVTHAPAGTTFPVASELVASYFIPFLNLYQPAVKLGELMHFLALSTGRFKSPQALVWGYWACWIGHTVLSIASNGEASQGVLFLLVLLTFVMVGAELVLATTLRGFLVELHEKRGTGATGSAVADVFR